MAPLTSFLRWATDNGVVSRLIPKESKGMGTGLFTSTDHDNDKIRILDQGELLFIPQKLLLSRSLIIGFNCPHFQKTFSIIGHDKVSERLSIILFILSQRLLLEDLSKQKSGSDKSLCDANNDNEHSDMLFAEYIATLPDVSTPVTLEPEMVRGYLAGTLLLDSVCAKRSKLEAEFEHLSGSLNVFDAWPIRPTLDNFIWADAIFWSRVLSFKTQWNETNTNNSSDQQNSTDPADDLHMVPYLDFANHATNSNIRWEVDSDGLRVWGLKSLLQDTSDGTEEHEVFLNYGNKPNTELLFLYGFTLKDNPTKCLTLALPMEEDDPYYMPKAHSLMRWGIPPRITVYLEEKDGPDGLEELCPGMWITRESRYLLWLYALNEDDGLGALIEEPESKVCIPQDTCNQDEDNELEEADLIDEDVVGRLISTINNIKLETPETLDSIVPNLEIFPVIKLRMLVLVAHRVEFYITRIMDTGDKVQRTEDVEIVRAVQYETEDHAPNSQPFPDHVEAFPASRIDKNIGECLTPTILQPDHTLPITNRQLEAEAQVSNLISMMKNYRTEEMNVLVGMSDILGEAQKNCLEESDFIQSYLARMQLQDS
ncbi:hypothetical protein FBU30_003330 [Linnemannia zychae]|nr:hypothetical protein FBU30_003330 [Linnemannia zychae]